MNDTLKDKENNICRRFELYFDGCYNIDPHPGVSCTFTMGVGRLQFKDEENVLHVWLRRPGLLIGRRGRIIDNLKEYLKCDIRIHEIKRLNWD